MATVQQKPVVKSRNDLLRALDDELSHKAEDNQQVAEFTLRFDKHGWFANHYFVLKICIEIFEAKEVGVEIDIMALNVAIQQESQFVNRMMNEVSKAVVGQKEMVEGILMGLWDVKTGEKMDKDRFRRDLGNVEDFYSEILQRLQKEFPHAVV